MYGSYFPTTKYMNVLVGRGGGGSIPIYMNVVGFEILGRPSVKS